MEEFFFETESRVKWARFGGYEVTTRGDVRFSAFGAIMEDGRSIEQHYQCDVKGWDVGGTNWAIGKGKAPKDRRKTKEILYAEYFNLWFIWSKNNHELMLELVQLVKDNSYILSDRFASSEINQARALSEILNRDYDCYF